MSTRFIATPTSRVRFGLARVEITPPVGIYHRVWGAAKEVASLGPGSLEMLIDAISARITELF